MRGVIIGLDSIRRIVKPLDPVDKYTFELYACNKVEMIIKGELSWEELKRATMLEDELLERILTRLAEEGKISRQ